MEASDILKYLDLANRRKWWIIIPFLLAVLGGLSFSLASPKIYEAETVILVQPQRVPQEFVRPIVSGEIEDRLKTISQQVTSRTNLEKIIKDYQLFDSASEKDLFPEQKVEALKKRIGIRVVTSGSGGNAFAITFQGKVPEKVMEVTNALASNFISENLKIRESQALGTSTFLADELESARLRLEEKEERLKSYREKYMGAMPEQLQTNLNILDKLQSQLDQLNMNLRDAENRKLIIQQQVRDSEVLYQQMGEMGSAGAMIEYETFESPMQNEASELASLKKRLDELRERYTDNHPDVKMLKARIAKLSKKEVEPDPGERSPEIELPEMEAEPSMVTDILKPQLEQLDLEISNLRSEVQKVKNRADHYQALVEETPRREQEILSLQRDYKNLMDLYNSLLTRKLEAELSLSMEKKQKGEQFRVIDPAKIPRLPTKPNIRLILLASMVLGLGLGGGLAFLKEMMDTSYKNPKEAEEELRLPLLVSLPIRHTQNELRRIRIKNILVFASVSVGFIVSAVGIVIAFKGLDKTIEYVYKVISGL